MSNFLVATREKFSAELAASPLRVKVISYTPYPFDLGAASARTCYSSKGILYPEDMTKSEKAREIRERVARSTLKSGHLTTRQHAHFVFGIEGISRQLLWQYLHAHPYYNSEQVSQRYVSLKNDGTWYSLPTSLRRPDVEAHMNKAFQAYTELNEILTQPVSDLFFSIHRLKAREKEKHADAIRKRTMEVARYVMPVATTAYLYHTISTLTLLRYVRFMRHDQSTEFTVLVLKMLDEVLRIDPDLLKELPEPLAEKDSTISAAQARANNISFDKALGNKSARLVKYTENAEHLLANMASYSGDDAEKVVHETISPLHNELLGDVFYPVTLDSKSRALNHIHFTFQKKISHTADSQEQRHRTLPGNRPLLHEQLGTGEDYIIPALIRHAPKALAFYENFMSDTFGLITTLRDAGVSARDLVYLLPNAFPVRYHESGDFLNFFHKWKSRLCYNAQEEIFYSSLDEVNQVREKMPMIGKYIGPPCHIRETLKPRCPEGDHFCGIKVWQLKPEEYNRII